ncbi:M14 family zinc carboxypeptidase [Streptomyces sp. NPDC051940]|uniref:M14 family zinc carboxypeptidase n=1 Tax=Streptomyces sp. NPDC051940 TaxID=3155675 RepID=UPI00341A624E
MKLLRTAAALGAAALLTALATAPAPAQDQPPQSRPNGPWVMPTQHESLAAIRDYPQLISTLERLVASGQGAELGYSPIRSKGANRGIPIVTIGDGPRGIVIIANQHGDEYVVSNSAVEIIRALTSNAAPARAIRDELTVTIMPRVNVDGFDATPVGEPWRQNVDPAVCPPTPCPAFYAEGRGYDINRYHSYLRADPRDDPNTGPVGTGRGDNPVPESMAVRAAYDAAGGADTVEVVMDLHHQGSPLDADGDLVTGSTLWPNATATADTLGIRPQFDDSVHRSKQVVSTLLTELAPYGYANFSRYPGTTPPGISRNAYGLLGSASVLVELRGVGQKAAGMMAQTGYVAGISAVRALANGSLYEADPAIAEALVLAPDSASLLGKCLAAREYTLENYNFCREKVGLDPVTTLPPPGEADFDVHEADSE